jgi:NAD(P)-dependent dehydrogenase (short-subunit alcohol dehydrogenase family)
MQDLKDKVAVVTGGNSGIGLGIARALASEGMNLMLTGMHAEKSEKAAKALRDEFGVRAVGVASDATRRDQVEALADAAFEEFGHVDMLVANAGVGFRGQIHEIGDNDWDWLMGVNLRGVYLACSVFIPRLLAQGTPSHIVITGSEQSVGMTPYGSMPVYAASKHAVLGLADALRGDYKSQGIDFTLVCPGPVATDIWDIERDRPEQYGERATSNEESKKIIMELGMDPTIVGRMTLKAIKSGDFYVFTHAYIRDLVEGRYKEMSAALATTDTWPDARGKD